MRYMILDLETETHERYKRKSNPFLPENFIVARGWKMQGDPQNSWEFYEGPDDVDPLDIPEDCDVIVAHNAKFELLYEMRFSSASLRAFFKRGGRIWCTQYAEYLLNAQQKKFHMYPLDKCAVRYGGKTKIDGVKALWEAGVLTSEIDRDLLTDYLVGTVEEGRNGGDIGNTELIYRGQLKAAEDEGMLEAIKLRMDGLCATADMEFNGLKIDWERARNDLRERLAEQKVADAALAEYTKDLPEGFTFNWNSVVHKSAIIYGGTVKYEKQAPYIDEKTGQYARKKETADWPLFDGEPVDPETLSGEPDIHGMWPGQDTFKGGKRKGEPKFKKVAVPGEIKVKYQPFFYEFPGYCVPDDDWKSELTDGAGAPVYSTSSDTIDRVVKRGSNIPFLKSLGDANRLTKEIGTYYFTVDDKGNKKGMLTCVDRETDLVHHKLNHTSTVTSRLSSSDPNLQNLTRADFDSDSGRYKSTIKAMFVSRFPSGKMVEIDYSQLEVVVQGLLTKDPQLVEDLNNKIDFHCKRVAAKNGITYEEALLWCKDENHPDHARWKRERTKCKIFSFQRAYGAGAALIADETGMSVEEVKALIEQEEVEYPETVKFLRRVTAEVQETSENFVDSERNYRTFRRGTFQVFTGTTYSFRSYDPPSFLQKKGIRDTFSPTEIANYPIQGTGGEIVQIVLGKLWRWFVKNDNFGGKALLVNTVHDCVWADCHPDVLDRVCAGMKKIMEAVPLWLKKHFNEDCPVPFPVDVEVGENMLELHHWEPE